MNGNFPDSPRIHPWHLIFWLSSLYIFVFIQKKLKINKIFELEKFQKFGLFEKEYIQTDLDRFNQDIRVVQCGYILFK